MYIIEHKTKNVILFYNIFYIFFFRKKDLTMLIQL